MTTKICTKCSQEKDTEEFPWKNSLLGKRHAACKSCAAERSKKIYEGDQESQIERVRINNQKYRENARDYARDYLSSHPCTECGETDPIALEFHHTGDKDTDVSRLIGWGPPIDVIQNEISKCSVVAETVMLESRPKNKTGIGAESNQLL